MDQQRRRDVRYPYRLPLVLHHGARQHEVHSLDVSFRGVFVATDVRIGLRQLVKVKATLPAVGPFETPAMVVFLVEQDNPHGRAPGLGVQFYGPEHAAWEKFIRLASREVPDEAIITVPELQRRKQARTSVVLRVETDHSDQLIDMYTTNISRGGMFLETEHEFKLGSELRVEVIHPETGDSMALTCRVRRLARPPEKPGIAVQFVGMTDELRDEFYQFAYVGSSSFGDLA